MTPTLIEKTITKQYFNNKIGEFIASMYWSVEELQKQPDFPGYLGHRFIIYKVGDELHILEPAFSEKEVFWVLGIIK